MAKIFLHHVPSQEFHLKTLERAMQHTSAVSSSLVSCCDTDKVLHKPSTNAIAENANEESRRYFQVKEILELDD
ncbi:hypothetical protein LOK49_Contig4G00022 [Camellia lanceoleosa]|nr:hypothetical protein LOK49_Contig4G00022 [Camellia lanceoleosa]